MQIGTTLARHPDYKIKQDFVEPDWKQSGDTTYVVSVGCSILPGLKTKDYTRFDWKPKEDEESDKEKEIKRIKRIFNEKLSELVKKNRGKYVAIVGNETIIGDTEISVYKEATAKYQNAIMYIRIIDDTPTKPIHYMPKISA